jgi:hypothetical protein
MDVCVVCVWYSKDKRHSQDNQGKEARIKNKEKNKSHLGRGCFWCVCGTVRTKGKEQDSQDKETRRDEMKQYKRIQTNKQNPAGGGGGKGLLK